MVNNIVLDNIKIKMIIWIRNTIETDIVNAHNIVFKWAQRIIKMKLCIERWNKIC